MQFFTILFILCAPILMSMCVNLMVQGAMGPCECAAFQSKEVQPETQPILKQNPMNVTCDTNGSETCQKLCVALAKAAKTKGPLLICSAIIHADLLTAYVYTKICNATSWIFTNISSPEPTCCHDGEPVTCKEVP